MLLESRNSDDFDELSVDRPAGDRLIGGAFIFIPQPNGCGIARHADPPDRDQNGRRSGPTPAGSPKQQGNGEPA